MEPMTNQSNTDTRFYLGEPGLTVVTYKIMDNSGSRTTKTSAQHEWQLRKAL